MSPTGPLSAVTKRAAFPAVRQENVRWMDPAGAGSGPTDGGGGSDVVAPGRFVVRFLNRPISEMLQRLSDGRNGPGRPSPTEVRHPSQHSFVAPPVAGCTVLTAS